MNKISFLGAAGEVTGSCFLLSSPNCSILVDFGMFQGDKETSDLNYVPLDFDPSILKGVFVTHAHLDHCGRLPLLVYKGFSGKIYMTAATLSLVEVILQDAAKIMQENREYQPLYGPQEVEKTLAMVEVVTYNKAFTVGDFLINYIDAGHILGSASIEITDTTDNKKIVFSGDLGNTPEDIVKPTEYPISCDFVVMESTYGDSNHPAENVLQRLQEEINITEQKGGVLLIPAFSIERTQDILHKIHHLKKDGKISAHTPVFLDSPMAIRATVIFRDFKEFYNQELQSHTDDPFGFEGLVITQEGRDSKDIAKALEPKVIIAGSGMLTGGRMLKHAINYLPRPSTRLLFVGYLAEETTGRRILEGAKSVEIMNTQVQIKATVSEIKSLSSHADQAKLLTWVSHSSNAKKVFLVHGDTPQRTEFAKKVKETLTTSEVIVPKNGQTLDL